MRANRFMVISLFLVYTLLYIEWDFSLITFCFSGNSPSWSFPSPCSLFTATEVIRTVTSKNVRCCGLFVFEIGKPVRAFPIFSLLIIFLRLEIYALVNNLPREDIHCSTNIPFIIIIGFHNNIFVFIVYCFTHINDTVNSNII